MSEPDIRTLSGDSKMRKHFFVIIVALLLTVTVCVAGCTSNNTSPTPSASATRSATFVPKNISGYRNYTNSSAGITIQYPPSWQHAEPGGGSYAPIAYFNVSGVDTSFTIVSESFSGQSMTLDGFSQGLISALQQNTTNFTYTLSNTALAGYPAQKIAFTLVSGGITRQGIIELTLVNDTGYALTYEAAQDVYPTYVGIAQNMMQSFNITG
jgi:hypothetical protein